MAMRDNLLPFEGFSSAALLGNNVAWKKYTLGRTTQFKKWDIFRRADGHKIILSSKLWGWTQSQS